MLDLTSFTACCLAGHPEIPRREYGLASTTSSEEEASHHRAVKVRWGGLSRGY